MNEALYLKKWCIFFNRQQDQPNGESVQAEESASRASPDEDHDKFWDLDDIPGDFELMTSFFHFGFKLFIVSAKTSAYICSGSKD